MFENYKVYETELAGRPLRLETGMMAGLANAAVMSCYGDTRVLCTVTASAKPREGVDFFPLSVDYEEKMYSVGRIPGSYTKREGKASDKAILASRCIDRPIRPLFPKDMRNDCSVVATVMSVDPDCSPEVTAMIGVSAAIAISDIPWDGPIGGIVLGLVDDQVVINPNAAQRERSKMYVTLAGTKEKICMIEAGAQEIGDNVVGVDRADELAHGQSRLERVVRRQNVAEIVGGDNEIDLRAHADPLGAHQREVRVEVIHDLGQQPAEVYGVGGG